ncbi:MAG: fumarate reductase/succinate dehydrogenase flavoprotein [uncultured bacterium]|nr:MAG: fumarate reductase/succinate dehydrogenase flavoprotein [uncultured bacterium]
MDYLIEAPQELPVIGEYDVLVLGGGPAGVSAAVSAAKAGAHVAIVERYGYLGGQATGGLVILLVGLTDGKDVIIKGVCEETINKLQNMGMARNIGPHILFDPEALKLIFDNMIEENNITPYYHSYVSNAIMAEEEIIGIVIESKSGRNVVKAKVFIDTTGDADLAKYCNVPFYQQDKKDLMPVTLGFRVGGIDVEKVLKFTNEQNTQYTKLIRTLGITTRIGGWIDTLHPGEAWFNISNITHINSTDSADLTKAEIKGRKQVFKLIESFKQNIPGFENGYLIDTASQLGIRESRRIKGLHYFTREDVEKDFEDTIAKAPNYTGLGAGSVNIPYRCLISDKCKNLIFAGRSISVDSELLNMFREIPCCMATGQAAGIVAAVISKIKENNVNNADIAEIKKILLQQGAVL